MKKILIRLFVAIVLFCGVSCAQMDKKAVTDSPSQPETEKFDDFFTVFCRDSLFRESRTVKPFPYLIETDQEIDEEESDNWEERYDTTYREKFPFISMEIGKMEEGTTFDLEKINSDSIILKIQIEDTGIQFWVIFSRKSKSDKWYAVECKDVST
jgi:hypothetical protein